MLRRAAAPDLRPGLSERCVRERLHGVVEGRELVGDPLQPVGRVEPTVERVNLVAQPVQPLEQGVELAVVEVIARFEHPR
jgi:hypothetical protein